MGTGCTSGNTYAVMPFAASTSAAAFANSSDLRRVSYDMTTPRFFASAPNVPMNSASPCVARMTVYMFIMLVP